MQSHHAPRGFATKSRVVRICCRTSQIDGISLCTLTYTTQNDTISLILDIYNAPRRYSFLHYSHFDVVVTFKPCFQVQDRQVDPTYIAISFLRV